jgi:hypothetical protein
VGRGYIEYHLEAAGRNEFVAYSAFLNYRLADGSTLSVGQQPAWCPACGHFVLAEWVPAVVEMERQLASVRAGEPETLQKLAFFDRSVEDEIAELTRRLTWRRGRQSPERCLHCGSDRVNGVPVWGEFSHPVTGERVSVQGTGFADMRTWIAEFSPEGITLG